MSGAGPDVLLLSQSPVTRYRQLNDLRFTDFYARNTIQPNYDVFLDQLEELPDWTAQTPSNPNSGPGFFTQNATIPNDGWVTSIRCASGELAAGSPGSLTMHWARILKGGPGGPLRWQAGTVANLGSFVAATPTQDYVVFDFSFSPLIVRRNDVFQVTWSNANASGAANNCQAVLFGKRLR